MELSDLIKLQNKHENELLQKENVVTVYCGYKQIDGQNTDELCLKVGVSEKLPEVGLFAVDVIPAAIEGVPTDVVQVGEITTHPKKPKKPKKHKKRADAIALGEISDPKLKYRPAMPGISIGHKSITAGTFSCVVLCDGRQMILSNNHVLAACNKAQIGDAIFQPGPADGGTSADTIGVLHNFIPINFGGSTPSTCPFAKGAAKIGNFFAKLCGHSSRLLAIQSEQENRVDAAICDPIDEITPEILQIGTPTGIAEAQLNMEVQKFGRTTEYTKNSITGLNATVQINYGSSGITTFKGQIITGPMSQGGDSGSAVLDMQGKIVGLLFAGSDEIMICNPIQEVVKQLNITLLYK